MAEAANNRQNLQNVPSIFEIAAAETLDNLICPALSKIFDYFGLRSEFKSKNGLPYCEHVPPLITWILQYIYISKRGSSFGESFYGLQRSGTRTGKILTRPQQIISTTFLTLLPHIEGKLKLDIAEHKDSLKWKQRVLNLLRLYNAAKTVQTFLYLIKYSSSHSPILHAMQLTLRYPNEPLKEDRASYIFLKMLEVLAFFLQFIQWWYSNDQRRKISGTLKDPKPMLDNDLMKMQKLKLPPPGVCPLCLMKLQTPTACSLSGYVFCFKCIMLHVKENGTCPVTNYSISLDDLVRIYNEQ